MNAKTLKPIEPDRRSGGKSAIELRTSEEKIVTEDISDEALEAASGLGDPANLPCTSPPCLASTFCENKC
jgi:hypothetical protein